MVILVLVLVKRCGNEPERLVSLKPLSVLMLFCGSQLLFFMGVCVRILSLHSNTI